MTSGSTTSTVLVVDDEQRLRDLVRGYLEHAGFTVLVAADGQAALELARQHAPEVVVLDLMLPGLDGLEVCRRLRTRPAATAPYVVLLTARTRREDVVQGLEAGADDFVGKPFDREELRARLNVGVRMVALQQKLAARVRELEEAMSRVQQLQGLLPICAYCKKIRNDENYWQQVEEYISAHSAAQFSHGICPQCYAQVLAPQLRAMREGRAARPTDG